jgi:C-terminal processing protease CtpA/Prc
VEWIHDTSLLGTHLKTRLELIYDSRPQLPEQYYVSLTQVGNPDFGNESAYPNLTDPDAGFRLLALFRHWNIIEYWFPYRDVLGEDWDRVLAEFVPILMGVEGADAYALAMMRLIARVNDTHANLWSRLTLRPPTGSAQVPVSVRFIEERAVVTGYTHEELGPASGLRVGDVILSLDEMPVDSLVEAWRPYYAASNQPTRLRDMARTLTRGGPGPVRVRGMREDGSFELTAERVPIPDLDLAGDRTHDLPGPTFQMLSSEVAYLKLSSVESANVGDYIREASNAEVLVVDIRNYPSEFVVFSLGNLLVSEPTPFARFTQGNMSNPGAFLWGPEVSLTPMAPRFEGKVVILVDEVSQSQAEYTTMAFRSSPRALVVGSTTAGADGNVSPIPLPGGLSTLISGIGVFYPDRSPTQRVGIIPDLEVRPTIQGIREGRDEVLEAGVSQALGRPFHMPRETAGGIR